LEYRMHNVLASTQMEGINLPFGPVSILRLQICSLLTSSHLNNNSDK
jgi:hypothetical protein